MFNWLRTLHNERRSRAYMIKEARRLLNELNIGTQANLSDKAVLALCVSFGTAYLQSLAIGKQVKDGALQVVFMALDGGRPDQPVH